MSNILLSENEVDLIIRTQLRVRALLEESKHGIEIGRETQCLEKAREELEKMSELVDELACLVSREE